MVEQSKRPLNLPPAATALWDWMEAHNLNQRQFAKVLGISHTNLNRYLRATRLTPDRDHMDLILATTGIPKALWLETRVAKSAKRRQSRATRTPNFHSGNVNV